MSVARSYVGGAPADLARKQARPPRQELLHEDYLSLRRATLAWMISQEFSTAQMAAVLQLSLRRLQEEIVILKRIAQANRGAFDEADSN